MNAFDRIACWFCRWRTAVHSRRVEKHHERTEYWSDRHLHFAVRHMVVGKPNMADVSDPPFLIPPDGEGPHCTITTWDALDRLRLTYLEKYFNELRNEQRARDAGA